MRQRPLLKTMFLLCAMLVWSHCLYAQGTTYYQKVTYTPITSGQYLIVCEGKNRILDGSLSNFEVKGNYKNVTISNNKIDVSSDTEAAEFTIEPALDAYSHTIYSFMNKAGKYIGNEHTNPGLEISTNAIPNIISIDNDGNATIYNDSYNQYKLQFNNNSNSLRFIYTNDPLTPVQLYKRMDITAPATIKINMNSYGLATYASSFDLNFSGVEGLEAYVASYGNGTIMLTKKDVIPAGQGMLLRATDGGSIYSVPTTTATEAVSGNLFVRGKGAQMGSGTGPVYGYILNVVGNEVGFYLANSQFVATNRAYLRIDTSQFTAGARIDLNFEDAAGINDVDQNHNENRNCYDLQGRRMTQPQQGLYIVNGKKVVIK